VRNSARAEFISETISQANAVAARAASILSRKSHARRRQTAWVDPNKWHRLQTCVHVCPYLAPQIGKDNKAEVQARCAWAAAVAPSSCPAKAITLHHYLDFKYSGRSTACWERFSEEKPIEATYLETVGSHSRVDKNNR